MAIKPQTLRFTMFRSVVRRHPSKSYTLKTDKARLHRQLELVREAEGEQCPHSPHPLWFPIAVSYSAVFHHHLGHQLVSRRRKKKPVLFCPSPISSAFCSESECLLGNSCQFLGEGFERQALVIRSNAVSDCCFLFFFYPGQAEFQHFSATVCSSSF